MLFADAALAILSDVARGFFVINHGECIASYGCLTQTKNHHRRAGRCFFYRLRFIIDHRAHATISGTSNHKIADTQRAFLHQYRRDCTLALIEPRFNDNTAGDAVWIGFKLQHFRLQQQ